MTALDRNASVFKMAVIFSFSAHLVLFLLILLSPHFPKSSRKEMIHYVSMVSFPGGGGRGGPAGGGGGAKENIAETTLPKRETLKDLTTLQKLQQQTTSSLRHPVEKPKKEIKPKEEKKAAIQKQQKVAQESQTGPAPAKEPEKKPGEGSGTGTGSGSGIRIGGGSGSGSGSGGGFGSAYSSKIGLSNFPYTYYLQIIIDRVSSNWFTSLVDPGISGNFQVTVYFRIHKNGQVANLKIEESSGVRSLDLSAQRAIRSSSPFPPLPRDYEDEYLGIFLIFEHSK
ncbi:MAG: energy transducer TonB [Candidatus Aminicenantaceae bacterium]